MRVNGKTIKDMEKASIPSKTEGFIKDNGAKEKEKDREISLLTKITITKEHGRMERNMDMVGKPKEMEISMKGNSCKI